MNLKDYLRTREGALKENRFHRYSILLLVLCVFVLAIGVSMKRQAVVLVPPTLDDRATVESAAADQEMQIAWGMYLAELLGNVTPTSAQFLKANVGRFLSPRLYQTVVDAIDVQVTQLQEEQITLQFVPTVAVFDPQTKKVRVSGEFIQRGVRGAERRGMRTYEMGFRTRNYRVILDELRICEGECKKPAETEA